MPPNVADAPRPTGGVVLSVGGDKIGTLPLLPGLEPLTSMTPLASVSVALLGQKVTVGYTGDSNYEASDGVKVSVPTPSLVTITATPRDTAAPVIDITSPADGARYKHDETVFATYACKDPDDRSAVTTCDGPIATGGALDTSVAGPYSFTVKSTDALGNATTKTVSFQVGGGPTAAPTTGSSAPDAPPARPATPAGAAAAPLAPPPAVDEPADEPPATRHDEQTAKVAPAAAVTRPKPTHGSSTPDEAQAKPASQEFAPYDPRSEPAKTLGILVAAFTLLQIGSIGGAGLSLARGGGGVGGSDSREDEKSRPRASFDYEGVDVQHLGAGVAAIAIGDRSRTWRLPGTRTVDALGAAVPASLGPRSPLLARVTADGTYLRAILGSGSLFTVLAGIALGAMALRDTGGEAIPPVAALTIAIAVLGVFDAMAGFVAVLIFTLGVLGSGGIDSNAHLRLMLGLSALWFVVPVLAGAVRPLRREPTRNLEQSWERAADFVIASLIGAWAVQKIVLALPGLAGVELPLTDYANTAAYAVLAALVVRLGLESIAAHLYPLRLGVAEPGELPEPGALQRLGACALRVAVFVFFAYIVVGSSWQLWVGAALFVIPQILGVYEERFPNSPGLFRVLPKGLVALVLMLAVTSAVTLLLISTMDEDAATFAANSFVLLSLPGFALSLLQLFGRDGDEPKIGWGKRLAGVGLVVVGVLVALGILLGTS